MGQVNVCIFESGEIQRDGLYSLAEFTKRTGLKDWAIRAARREGFRVLYVHNRAYICGGDWIDYCMQTATADPIPDAGPTDADMRGEVDHGP